jgi:hypothetical protein
VRRVGLAASRWRIIGLMPMVITAATARTRSVSGAPGGASRSHRLMNWARNIFLRAPLSDISVCMAAWFCSMKWMTASCSLTMPA